MCVPGASSLFLAGRCVSGGFMRVPNWGTCYCYGKWIRNGTLGAWLGLAIGKMLRMLDLLRVGSVLLGGLGEFGLFVVRQVVGWMGFEIIGAGYSKGSSVHLGR